ncbi:MAG: class I SAM-dependent methyltransferase [Ignavibacteriaceae bacterium]|nr:class I SAM-dependent methyltransferase [Ignavibacteriaceae bacterium]
MTKLSLNAKLVKDIFDWDRTNWSESVRFWENWLSVSEPKKVLTLGEKHGGLTLLFALYGHNVTSTDLEGVTEKALRLHSEYGVTDKISYANANMLEIPFEDNSFEYVAFKSVLGALRSREKQEIAIKEMRRVLKPGGTLLFAENLLATKVHQLLRKKFIPWAHYWCYLSYHEKEEMFRKFTDVQFQTYGMIGALAPNEKLRFAVGHLDKLISPLFPPESRYILFGACTK